MTDGVLTNDVPDFSTTALVASIGAYPGAFSTGTGSGSGSGTGPGGQAALPPTGASIAFTRSLYCLFGLYNSRKSNGSYLPPCECVPLAFALCK